jgi:hypothetical protein
VKKLRSSQSPENGEKILRKWQREKLIGCHYLVKMVGYLDEVLQNKLLSALLEFIQHNCDLVDSKTNEQESHTIWLVGVIGFVASVSIALLLIFFSTIPFKLKRIKS